MEEDRPLMMVEDGKRAGDSTFQQSGIFSWEGNYGFNKTFGGEIAGIFFIVWDENSVHRNSRKAKNDVAEMKATFLH